MELTIKMDLTDDPKCQELVLQILENAKNTHPLVKNGSMVEDTSDSASSPSTTEAKSPAGDSQPEPKAMTKAKELAEKHGIDWRKLFPGSGKNGIVRQDDVQRAIKARQAEGGNGAAGPSTGMTPKFDDVRGTLAKLVQEQGRDAASALLRTFNVEKVSALPESQWAGFIVKVEEKLAST